MKIAKLSPKNYDNMFGNRNYDFVVENGLLVANFEDDPHRANSPHHPLQMEQQDLRGFYPQNRHLSPRAMTARNP